MNDSTPPEDGEPTSLAEAAKNWYRKHKPKIRVVGGAVGSMALFIVVASLAARQDAERYDAGDIEYSEPGSALEATDEPHQSPSDYDVDPFLRKLPEGQNASEEAKRKYEEATGNDLPPGYTYVDGWSFRGDSPGDEDPGPATA